MLELFVLCQNTQYQVYNIMKFNTQFEHTEFIGEVNSGELVTEPGQAFTTREIYERYLATGRVVGGIQPQPTDEDELGKEPSFDDLDETQSPEFTRLDALDRSRDLTNVRSQREAIVQLSLQYQQGKISYDEFVDAANRQNSDMAAPYIQHFGKLLREAPKPESTPE